MITAISTATAGMLYEQTETFGEQNQLNNESSVGENRGSILLM